MKALIVVLLAVGNMVIGCMFLCDLILFYESKDFMVSNTLNRGFISWVGCTTAIISGIALFIYGANKHSQEYEK